jgi:hypothetical protein
VWAPIVSATLTLTLLLTGVIGGGSGSATTTLLGPLEVPTVAGDPAAGAVPDGPCAAASRPEPALQGEVPLKDRQDGRSELGYACNLSLVGRYQGQGAAWVSQSYGHCAYMSAAFPFDQLGPQPGVRVVDASDQAHPKLTEVLTSPAMTAGTWESLRVNAKRGLLAAVAGGTVGDEGVGFFDVYDISKDCAHPVLLNHLASSALSLPASGVGHEGGWAPDGRTYYAAGVAAGTLTAIDVSDPSAPRILWTGITNVENHGFSFTPDGNTMYIGYQNNAGVDIFDVSAIQKRAAIPGISFVGGLHWNDGQFTQATTPVSYHGVPYLIAWDELDNGGVRFLNISNPAKPVIVKQIRLAIQLPQNKAAATADTAGTGQFGYQSHYCTVDRPVDPTALACGWFQSGIRVFDIRDFQHPREIAYFNPPAQTGKDSQLMDSEHAQSGASGLFVGGSAQLTADYCSSPPAFVGNELWVTCQDNGFMILRFGRGVFPFPAATKVSPRHHRAVHHRRVHRRHAR